MEVIQASYSKVVVFDNDDIESHLIMTLFKQLQFIYGGMSNVPTHFNYEHLKDLLKWHGLKRSSYTQLFIAMFNTYCNNLPTKN